MKSIWLDEETLSVVFVATTRSDWSMVEQRNDVMQWKWRQRFAMFFLEFLLLDMLCLWQSTTSECTGGHWNGSIPHWSWRRALRKPSSCQETSWSKGHECWSSEAAPRCLKGESRFLTKTWTFNFPVCINHSGHCCCSDGDRKLCRLCPFSFYVGPNIVTVCSRTTWANGTWKRLSMYRWMETTQQLRDVYHKIMFFASFNGIFKHHQGLALRCQKTLSWPILQRGAAVRLDLQLKMFRVVMLYGKTRSAGRCKGQWKENSLPQSLSSSAWRRIWPHAPQTAGNPPWPQDPGASELHLNTVGGHPAQRGSTAELKGSLSAVSEQSH